MSVPIGPCWAQPSWRDDVWALGTWGAGVVTPPTIPDTRIGAASGNSGGFELYASMRAAEAQRRGEEKPIASLVKVVEPVQLVVVPALVVPERRITPLEPADVEANAQRLAAIERHAPNSVSAVDAVEEVVVEPEPEPYTDSAINAIRYRAQSARDRQQQIAEFRADLFARGRKPEPVRQLSPVAHATLLAQTHRQILDEEELAWVLLIVS